jgi:hypothetical protein
MPSPYCRVHPVRHLLNNSIMQWYTVWSTDSVIKQYKLNKQIHFRRKMKAIFEDWELYCSDVEVFSLATGVCVSSWTLTWLITWHVHGTQSGESSPASEWIYSLQGMNLKMEPVCPSETLGVIHHGATCLQFLLRRQNSVPCVRIYVNRPLFEMLSSRKAWSLEMKRSYGLRCQNIRNGLCVAHIDTRPCRKQWDIPAHKHWGFTVFKRMEVLYVFCEVRTEYWSIVTCPEFRD